MVFTSLAISVNAVAECSVGLYLRKHTQRKSLRWHSYFFRHTHKSQGSLSPTKAAFPLPIASAVTGLAPTGCFAALMAEFPRVVSLVIRIDKKNFTKTNGKRPPLLSHEW